MRRESRHGAAIVGMLLLAATTGCSGGPREATSSARTDVARHQAPADGTRAVSPRPRSSSPPPPSIAPTASCALPITAWTVHQLAGAVITAPARMDDLSASRALVTSGVGGLILFGNPPDNLREQLAQLVDATPAAWPLLVASDEEGGAVQRLARLTGPRPAPRELARQDLDGISATGRDLGAQLRRLGVRVDLAPVADLDSGPGPDARHPVGSRSFSIDPATAASDAIAFARGLQAGGVVPVVKHFPGIGTATANTDDSPARTAPWSVLQPRDLRPFAAAVAAGLPAVMTSHVTVPGLTATPVSLSRVATQGVLRDRMGFSGVVFTDSLSAAAVRSAGLSVPGAAVAALVAGADVILFGNATTRDVPRAAAEVRAAIELAVTRGQLSITRLRQSVARIAAMLGRSTC